MLKPPPDKQADDILFGDVTGKTHGDRTQLALLMGVENSNITQQLDPHNRNRSYFHCGKLALYAAYMMDEVRGETLWQDLVRTRQTWVEVKPRLFTDAHDDIAVKTLCDGLTTALLSGDEAAKASAMTKLNAVLSARLSRVVSPMQREREARLTG